MSGFALLIDQQSPVPNKEFRNFLKSVVDFKSHDTVTLWEKSTTCFAAKLDSKCSLHKGVVEDEATGSWILAVGTVMYNETNPSSACLHQLLTDYLEKGERVFSGLDGQFVLVLHDKYKDVTLVLSDPFGMIPVYYGKKGSQFLISTSALAIAKALQSKPSDFGVRSFILYGETFGDTLWQDIRLLPPATIYHLEHNDIRFSSYWSFQVDATIAGLNEDQSVDCMIEGLSKSMRNCLDGEEKIWISLTGGLDSRTLAALADYCQIPFKTYCHGPIDSRDVKIAEKISHQIGWEYEYFSLPKDWGTDRVSWFDHVLGQTDGQLDLIKMSRTIREQTIKGKQMDVSLWGFGGELYRGIYWKQELWRTGKTSRVDYERLLEYRVIPTNSQVLKNTNYWKRTTQAEIKNRFIKIGEQQPDFLNTIKLNLIGLEMERHACGSTIASVLGHQRVLLPFDLKENISRIFSINYKWCTQGRMFRLILERINPELAKMEIADGGPATPMRLNNLLQFVPYWLDYGEKLFWRLGKKTLGKELWRRRIAGQTGYAYPEAQWLRDTVNKVGDEYLLTYGKMLSEDFYEESQLKPGSITNESLLGRILAVEMALRSIV